MKIKPIKTEKDYNQALERLEVIFDAKKGTKEGDELEILGILIDNYENEFFPINLPDPIEAIKFRMDQLGLKQSDIAEVIGGKNRASEILNRKRELTAKMMRDLHKKYNIPAQSLLS